MSIAVFPFSSQFCESAMKILNKNIDKFPKNDIMVRMEELIAKILPYAQIRAKLENFSFEMHSHHTIEIVYIVRGIAEFSFAQNDGTTNKIAIRSNQFVILRPHCRHTYEIHDETEFMVLELGCKNASVPIDEWLMNSEYADKISFAARLLKSPQKYIVLDDTQNVQHTLSRLINIVYQHEHGEQNEFFGIEYEIYLLDLLVKVCQCNRLLIDRILANRHIHLSLLYIAENYAKRITVPQIAQFVHVSPSYLQRLFKQTYGQSVLSVLTHQRLIAAEKLLKTSDISVGEISDKVGYPNKQAFNAAFRKAHGISPADYRKKHGTDNFVFYRDYSDIDYTLDVSMDEFIGTSGEE